VDNNQLEEGTVKCNLTLPWITQLELFATTLLLILIQTTSALAQGQSSRSELGPPLQLDDGWKTGNLGTAWTWNHCDI